MRYKLRLVLILDAGGDDDDADADGDDDDDGEANDNDDNVSLEVEHDDKVAASSVIKCVGVAKGGVVGRREGGTYLAVAPLVVVAAADAVHCPWPMHLAMIHNTKDAAQSATWPGGMSRKKVGGCSGAAINR